MVDVLKESLKVTLFVFGMMVIVELLMIKSRGKFGVAMKGGRWRQYLIASFLGATPGCFGAFAVVSMYVHGVVGFGALVACMIATSGDESFVMLKWFPMKALLLFMGLFVIGMIGGWIADAVGGRLGICISKECRLQVYHEDEASYEHFFKEHIWRHIIKKHIWRVFLWTFGAMLIVHIGMEKWHLEEFVKAHMMIVLLVAVLVGIIPESGPHMVFITMYSQGLIPLSVLVASSIVQDGHGMLPMLSYSLKDSGLVKAFNVAIGLIVGGLMYLAGF